MLTLLTVKIDLGTYGISDRQVLGIFDNDDDLQVAIRLAHQKWKNNKIIFHSEVITLNRAFVK